MCYFVMKEVITYNLIFAKPMQSQGVNKLELKPLIEF